MSILEKVAEDLAGHMVSALPAQAHERLGALLAAHAARPDADVFDQMKLANYLLYGTDEVELATVQTMDGTVVGTIPTQQPSFPFPSGDMTVLGPQIFASTPEPSDDTVINWRGANFAPQDDHVSLVDEGYHVELNGYRFSQGQWEAIRAYCEGSAEVSVQEPVTAAVVPPNGDDPGPEPAPSAGLGWRGRRGDRPS